MPWCYAMLRGTRVLARCLPSGELDAQGGRVEIRYRPTDARAYRAGARNLKVVPGTPVLPDDHCVDGEPVAAGGDDGTRRRSKPKAKKQGAPKPGDHPERPEGEEVLVYADGACSGNPGPAGLGVVMRFDDEQWELSEHLGKATNNIAELTAILRACEGVPDGDRPLRIHTDSGYSIGVLTKGWKAKANRELVASVKQALAAHGDVRLFHVPGHAGVPLNERADTLARQAIELGITSQWVRVDPD